MLQCYIFQEIFIHCVFTFIRKTPKKILRGFLVDSWLAGVQPVRNTRAVLSMVSASDDTRVSNESIVSNHN